jgi:hypothetical protein
MFNPGRFLVSKLLTVAMGVLVLLSSGQVHAAPIEKFDQVCSRLIGDGSGSRLRSHLRRAFNFPMEASLRRKLGDEWRQDLLKSEILNWEQKNLTNAELAYLTAERKPVVAATPIKKLSLARNSGLTDIKTLRQFIEVLGGKIEELDISDLALENEPGIGGGGDNESAGSYFQMYDFLASINQFNPEIKMLSISHLNGTYLNVIRNMRELQALDIHNSHFRTPVNNFVFRKHDPTGSISTRRWLAFLSSPPPKLKKITIPPFFNNADEDLERAETLAARSGIELNKKSVFEEVRIDDAGWASLQNRKIPMVLDGRPFLVGLQSTVLPPANADLDAAKKIHKAVSNYIFWHLSAANKVDLANVIYMDDGFINANVKYRIGNMWYSLARGLQRLGISYGQSKPLGPNEWRHISWDYIYMKHKADIDRWLSVNP